MVPGMIKSRSDTFNPVYNLPLARGMVDHNKIK